MRRQKGNAMRGIGRAHRFPMSAVGLVCSDSPAKTREEYHASDRLRRSQTHWFLTRKKKALPRPLLSTCPYRGSKAKTCGHRGWFTAGTGTTGNGGARRLSPGKIEGLDGAAAPARLRHRTVRFGRGVARRPPSSHPHRHRGRRLLQKRIAISARV